MSRSKKSRMREGKKRLCRETRRARGAESAAQHEKCELSPEEREQITRNLAKTFGRKVAILDSDKDGTPKMSEVFLEFLDPFMENLDTGPDYHTRFQALVALGVIAWNAAIVPNSKRDELLKGAFGHGLKRNPDLQQVGISLVKQMVMVKDAYFREDRRFIVGHEILGTEGNVRMNVSWVSVPETGDP